MAFDDLLKRAPGLVVMWILAIMLVLVIIIFYIMQTQHINKGGRTDTVRNLGNAMGGLGIVVCVVGAVWIILLVQLMRNARNIWTDASSLYVSRANIFTNWWSTAVTSKTGNSISGRTNPDDDTECFGAAGLNVQAGPEAYDPYRTLLKAYNTGQSVPQTYDSPVGPTGTTFPAYETLDTQQKLSFAYYRYVYCAKSYFEDIVNKKGLDQTNFPFLSKEVLANLQAGKSNCNAGNVPDTVACTDGGTPGPGQCAPNACFIALNEAITAQCLLYDDYVYKRLNPNAGPLGVLGSMGLTQAVGPYAALGVPGLQVRSPD